MSLACAILVLTGVMSVRNVFVTIQLFATPEQELWTREVWFWVFEAGMMVCYSAGWHGFQMWNHGGMERAECGRGESA